MNPLCPSALNLSFGIEEEFFLVDPRSGELASETPPGFLAACRSTLGERVGDEMLRPQIEVASPVLYDSQQARTTLPALRSQLSGLAAEHGLGLVAAGTHPFGNWAEQRHTRKDRYERLIDDYQIVGRRNLFCGLHVHVGIPTGIDRVALMNRLMRWAPLFLALSTSSPFWNGSRTGLLSYRQTAYDEWPRSGIPDAFSDEAEYDAFIRLMASCGALQDGSYLWWAIRPSARFPTLELRIADACTDVADSLALAAAFRCLVRAHLQRPEFGRDRTPMSRRIIDENRWRAKRYGTDAEIIDESAGVAVGFVEALEEMLTLITPDAAALGCEREIHHLRTLVSRGTSAHTQLAIYRRERGRCQTREAALKAVVDWLATATTASYCLPDQILAATA